MGEVFEAALALRAEDRDEFVRQACGGDREMEAEVRSLLSEHLSADGFLDDERLALPIPRPAPLPEPATVAGRVIGGWRVIRELGRGGMGVVWLVEREAEGFCQQGALKLLRHGLMTEEMIRRFRRERRILATLSHPGIARLLDGGTTADGVPYLVMEYVDGHTLYEYCARNSLGLGERLRLLIEVCEAVESAHRRLVLHRDLKPSNVMVTSEGRIKLLDFGVAKMFEEDEPESQALRTLDLPATPGYASPEQLTGGTCTTASDVYSLGVVLFELATGRSPFRGEERHGRQLFTVPRASAVALESRGEESSRGLKLPPPPSSDPRALARAVSGDVDTMTAKALESEPARRYESVAALAEDLTNYIEGRPLRARPASWRYQVAKFVRRNRFAVTAAGVGLLALFAGLGTALWQASLARREARVAEERLREVRSMTRTLVFDVHDAVARLPGSAPARELVVTRAVEYLDRLASQAAGDTLLMSELADAYERLALAQGDLLRPDAAAAGRISDIKSLRLREALLAVRPGDAGIARAIAVTRDRLERLRVFDTGFEDGTPAEFWAPGTQIVRAQGYERLGSPANAFTGHFLRYASPDFETVKLTLRDLPPHRTLSLSFLLAVIDSWDGTEVLEVRLDDRVLFAHWFQLASGDTSSYAAPPGALLSRGTNLGFNDNTYYNHDRAYDLSVDPAFSSIPHTADSVTVTWRVVTPMAAGMGSQQWQGLDDESWAIDNVRVEVAGIPVER
jgi:serine/threonine protein kinase